MTWRAARIVFVKELVDALRDRRTLAVVLLSSVLMGPLVLVALSALVASLEAGAERREVLMDGIERAPTLVNYLRRQSVRVAPAPAGYEAALRAGTLGAPVLVPATDFEAALRRGEAARLTIVSASANRRAEAGSERVQQLLGGFRRERATLALALRGVAAELLEPLRLQPRDLAGGAARGAQFTAMLPFFVLLAVLYGALNAALDSTAGERERGSLEPLLLNPARPIALVLGKWGAVWTVALLIALLACAGFIPAQWLLRSDTLAALFRYGAREALWFVAIVAPFAAAVSALLMAVAIRCRSVKEAQASAALLVLALSLLPLASLIDLGAESPWQAWVPGLAQNALMTRVLRGEAIGLAHYAPPLAVGVALAAAGIFAVARTLRGAALR